MFPLKDNIPTDRFPVVTMALIVANVIVYFLLEKGGLHGPSQQVVVDYGFIPYELTHPGAHCELVSGGQQLACGKDIGEGNPSTYVTIFTSMFMHGGLLHIGGNMLFLWIFGNNVEDSMGRVKFLLFYLAGGVAAVALQTAVASGRGGADDRRLGGDRRGARRLHRPLSPRPRGDADLHHPVLHDRRAAGGRRCSACGSCCRSSTARST